jgi:hypothetical protein
MKKAVIFVVLAMVLIGSCFAQSANNAQRIIGTWVDNNTGKTWVFNANGTVSGADEDGDTFSYKFGVTDAKIAFFDDGTLNIFNLSISSDGKTLILEMSISSRGDLYLEASYWFTKR